MATCSCKNSAQEVAAIFSILVHFHPWQNIILYIPFLLFNRLINLVWTSCHLPVFHFLASCCLWRQRNPPRVPLRGKWLPVSAAHHLLQLWRLQVSPCQIFQLFLVSLCFIPLSSPVTTDFDFGFIDWLSFFPPCKFKQFFFLTSYCFSSE